jgi:hypothetical protein
MISTKSWLIEMSDFWKHGILLKWSQPGRSNPAFSPGAENFGGYVEPEYDKLASS